MARLVSVVAGFYRTCVIDGVLPVSSAEDARRPVVSADSPTLGLSHLQFEALLTAAQQSTNDNDFALVAMFGLLGLRIFEATGADISTLARNTGTECCGTPSSPRCSTPASIFATCRSPPTRARRLDRQYADAEEVEFDKIVLDVGRDNPVPQLLDECHLALAADGIRFFPWSPASPGPARWI